jgi:hypothetical protein
MVKSCGTVVCLISICLLAVGLLRADEGEKNVKLKDLPEAVRKTVREQSKDARMDGLSMEVENGRTSYEAELKVKGRRKDILIDAAGAVLEVEESVDFSTLPGPVKERLKKSAGKGKITRVEAVTKSGAPAVYEALVNLAGKKSEIQVAADGTLLSPENKEKGSAKMHTP